MVRKHVLREQAVYLAKQGHFRAAGYLLKEAAEQGDESAYNDIGVIAERHEQYDVALECYEYAHECGLGVASRNIGNL